MPLSLSIFFFNDTATTEIYTLSLHDALPISRLLAPRRRALRAAHRNGGVLSRVLARAGRPFAGKGRSTWHRASGAEPPAGEQRAPRGRLPQARALHLSIQPAGRPAGNGGGGTPRGRAAGGAGHPARPHPPRF